MRQWLEVCEEAIAMGWIDTISDVDVQRVSHANVVPTLDRRANLNKILGGCLLKARAY